MKKVYILDLIFGNVQAQNFQNHAVLEISNKSHKT